MWWATWKGVNTYPSLNCAELLEHALAQICDDFLCGRSARSSTNQGNIERGCVRNCTHVPEIVTTVRTMAAVLVQRV